MTKLFTDIISKSYGSIISTSCIYVVNIFIVQAGIKGGIENASKWMMPLLFIFFILLFIRSITLEGAMEGVKFMFVPDWSYLTGKTFLLALGQAFFSLSVGVCAMMSYSSYLSKEEEIVALHLMLLL